jgi:hypothetical protein
VEADPAAPADHAAAGSGLLDVGATGAGRTRMIHRNRPGVPAH